MKVHTTNYFDTFIEIAEDTKVDCGTKPPVKENRTIAEMQYDLIARNPYKFTSDDILFQVFADRNDLTKTEYKQAQEQFFSKGQACLRASPLTKTYGFGIHFDSKGKIAIYGAETPEYAKFTTDNNLKKVKAVRSKR
ncbi:DUF6157 family protein [Flavobacterium sp. ZB4P13]|uniref:DUF6157 family protein n=1 Tax=Flavobacterium sp. ZB4P13 TaxID=3401728 RepID=UPI003AAB175A